MGGSDLLQRLGIDVIVDNPYVGENLQNDLFTGLAFEVGEDVDDLETRRYCPVVRCGRDWD